MSTADHTRTAVVGALAGAGAYVVGYLLVYLVAADRLRESLVGGTFEAADIGIWKGVGWTFYNLHFVDVVGSFSAFGLNVTQSLTLVGDVVSPAFYLLPPLLLGGAGVVTIRAVGIPGEASGAAIAGGTVVAGYFPLAVLGAVVVGVSGDATTVGPDLLPAAVAGAVYPAVFGAFGGVLARGAA